MLGFFIVVFIFQLLGFILAACGKINFSDIQDLECSIVLMLSAIGISFECTKNKIVEEIKKLKDNENR